MAVRLPSTNEPKTLMSITRINTFQAKDGQGDARRARCEKRSSLPALRPSNATCLEAPVHKGWVEKEALLRKINPLAGQGMYG